MGCGLFPKYPEEEGLVWRAQEPTRWRFSSGGQLGYKKIDANNIPDLTDPRAICRAGIS
jgi:hypothetical protein